MGVDWPTVPPGRIPEATARGIVGTKLVGLPADFTPMHTQPHQNSIPNQSLLSGIERRTWKAEGRTVGRCRHNNLPFKEHTCFFLFIIGNTKKEEHFFLGNVPMSRDLILEANFSCSFRAD